MRSEPDDVEFRVATEVVTGTFSCTECAHGTAVRNEPLQIGVRSVVEMFVYGMLTEGFGLPVSPECELVSLEYPYTLQAEE